jgi:hypothetical protein
MFFRFWRDKRESIDFSRSFRFVAEKYPLLPEGKGGVARRSRDGVVFICTLYVSCYIMSLIQFLQNE